MSLPFSDLTVIKKFPSRKNTVYLVDRGGWRLVLKVYENGRCKNEADVLVEARKAGIAVPDVVEANDNAILMEFVPGKLVNDFLGTERMREAVLGVAGWLARYHKTFRCGDEVRVKSDAIFKNFIVSLQVYGLDFENSHVGRPEEDVGEALAYLLDTNPMFADEKFKLGLEFVALYEKESGIRLTDVDEHVARALEEAAGFRPMQAEVLLKKAGEIRASKPFTLVR